MVLRRCFGALVGAFACLSLFGCTANIPVTAPRALAPEPSAGATDLRALYSTLGASGGRVFRLDPQSSTVRIYVFRGGAAAKLGHNHVLSAPHFAGYVFIPRSGPADGRFDLELRLQELELDAPEVRAHLGGAFSSEISPADIERTRAHMLGEENLQAQRFPFVRIHSLQIVGEVPNFAAQVQIELHGQQQDFWVPLRVEGLPDQISVSGSLVLRQTEFAVRPISALGGLLTVHDEVLIDFRLAGA